MEIKNSLELISQRFNPKPTYHEILTRCPPDYWMEKTQAVLENIIPASNTFLIRNPFDRWVESSAESVYSGAENFITGFGRRFINTSSSIAHLELRIFDAYHIPLLNGHPDKTLLDLFAIEETRLGDGIATYDKDTGQWGFTQRHGVRQYPSHFMVMCIE